VRARLTEITTAATLAARVEDDRLPAFFGGPDDAHTRLAASSVLVAGCGSVGARVGMHVARLGVGEVALVDPKVFKPNFGTQAIMPDDVGAPKAVQIAHRAKAVAPDTRVRAAVASLQDLDWGDIADFDVIIASTDNLKAEVEIGRVAMGLGIPLLYASVHGPTLTAQLRVLTGRADGACIACNFTDAEWQMAAEDQARFECAGGDAGDAAPTMSVSALCGLAADMASLQLLRHLLDLGQPLEDTMLEFNGYTSSTLSSPLHPNPACRAGHERFDRGDVPDLGHATLRQCAAAAGMIDDITQTLIRVGHLTYATHVQCHACGRSTPRPGFGLAATPVEGVCPGCDKSELFLDAGHMFTDTPASAMTDVLDQPLSTVGAVDAGSVTIRAAGRATLVTAAAGEGKTR
jgi:adenylyltransferase/sulfurtransferase